MPAKHDFPTEYTNGGTPARRGMSVLVLCVV